MTDQNWDLVYSMEPTCFYILSEEELGKCGSITLPVSMSKEGRIFKHPDLGKLRFLGKSDMEGQYYLEPVD